MPSHGHGLEFSDDGKLAINWMTGSPATEVVLELFMEIQACVRLQTVSALSVHSNAQTFVVSRTALM